MAFERELAQAYCDRARAELDDLLDRGFSCAGSAFPQVLLVKGRLNEAEEAGGALLGGPDGDALRAALARLGYPDDAWAALSACVAPSGGPWALAEPFELAVAVEAFDPEAVLALDSPAARSLQAAWGLPEPLGVGAPVRVRGRRVLALGGFEAALGAPGGKAAMWARLKLVPPLGAPL